MTSEVLKALKAHPNVQAMMDGIPQELWEVFLPSVIPGLSALEARIIALKARAGIRERVMSIQRLCGFPLRPNASLRETTIRARIEGLKKGKLQEWKKQQEKERNEESDDKSGDE